MSTKEFEERFWIDGPKLGELTGHRVSESYTYLLEADPLPCDYFMQPEDMLAQIPMPRKTLYYVYEVCIVIDGRLHSLRVWSSGEFQDLPNPEAIVRWYMMVMIARRLGTTRPPCPWVPQLPGPRYDLDNWWSLEEYEKRDRFLTREQWTRQYMLDPLV
jgi:hypothetical protein